MQPTFARWGQSIAAALCLALAACAAPTPDAAPQASEWRALFDGHTTAGWRTYNGAGVDPRWAVEDGALTLTAGGAGDIITEEEFENFELSFEWRISEGGNSGVFYNVIEGDFEAPYFNAPEYQVLDNDGHADGQTPSHRAGANYDLDVPRVDATRPVGQWNEARIVIDHGRVQHWLNGQLVVEYELWTPQWEAAVAASKFATMPAYGRAHSGHIGLQDHGDRVWYRNIKIRTL